MSDKKMLNETTIRKMMKLANIPSLTDKFIKENYFDYPQVTEQEEEELDIDVEDEDSMDIPLDDVEVDAEVELDTPDPDELPAPEDLVQDLMGVLEKHFEDVVFNVNVEGGGDPLDEPTMDIEDEEEETEVDLGVEEPADDIDLDVDVDEEEPVLEEVPGNLADLGAMAAGEKEEEEADAATGEGGLQEEETLEEEDLEDADAHSKLIDAIAAKVAERLLAEAKKTNE